MKAFRVRLFLYRSVSSVASCPRSTPSTMTDWAQLPEVPQAEELMETKPPQLPILDKTSTGTKLEYLATQYRLHRYAATEVLRRAIVQYRRKLAEFDIEHVRVYRGVRASGYVVGRQGVACRLAFSAPENATDQQRLGKPEDLTPGSLVVLSPHEDDFKTKCLVGTVAPIPEDPEEEPPPTSVVDLYWADAADAVVDPTLKLVMLEPTAGYFESLRHTMTGLQQAALSEHRIDKYLYEPFTEIKSPQYLKEMPENKPFYPERVRELDDSQMEALKMATSQELAIIQGPPGTGKTFTSIMVIETIIKTLKLCQMGVLEGPKQSMAPIIVAAQTNHAVDQILLKCKELGIGTIARLGGRSENETIKECGLINLRQRCGAFKPDGTEELEHRNLQRQISSALRNRSSAVSLLKAEQLYDFGVISEDQYQSLVQDNEWETGETDSKAKNAPCAMTRWLDEYTQQPDFQRARQNHTAEAQSDSPSLRRKLKSQKFHSMQADHLQSVLRIMHQDADGTWSAKAKHLLANSNDLYEIKPADRGAVYDYLHEKLEALLADQIRELISYVNNNLKLMRVARRTNELKAIRRERVKILGCTTTGLLKHRDLLERLSPRVLLVEEAAETREANVAAALTPSIEQLILIGDHQQLTPNADLMELCKDPHRLDISLFERFVNRKVDYCSLRVQRRMISELREVVEVFYPGLQDHETVKSPERRKPIPGMQGCHLWWFQHSWNQERGLSGLSYANPQEARMIVEFTRYLVQRGVSPHEISILTYYSSQRELIKRELAMDDILGNADILGAGTLEWSVRTIDDFQGEENEIIILSLVRGPDADGQRARPGFVANENRAVVATSRARRGFYIFGNAQNLLQGRSRQVWEKVLKAFGARTGRHMPVTCSTHGTEGRVTYPADWRNFSPSGCSARCLEQRIKSQVIQTGEQTKSQKRARQVGINTLVRTAPRSTSPVNRAPYSTSSVSRAAYSTSPDSRASHSPEPSTALEPQKVPFKTSSTKSGSTMTTTTTTTTTAQERIPDRYTSEEILQKGMRTMFAGRDNEHEASERAMSATSGPTDSSRDSELEDLIRF